MSKLTTELQKRISKIEIISAELTDIAKLYGDEYANDEIWDAVELMGDGLTKLYKLVRDYE